MGGRWEMGSGGEVAGKPGAAGKLAGKLGARGELAGKLGVRGRSLGNWGFSARARFRATLDHALDHFRPGTEVAAWCRAKQL